MYRRFFKIFFDVFIALIAIICLNPLLLVLMILLFFANKGAGIFFIQQRVGKDARLFRIIKFKTMSDQFDSEGKLLPDEDRLTSIGRFVRFTSLDELPQLFNVLKGDMSLIGPRPLLVKYLPLYSPEQARRHEVRPGITGWAQCRGRNAICWQEKFQLDVWYVDNISFSTDLKILFLTMINVIKREGINLSQPGPFTGNN